MWQTQQPNIWRLHFFQVLSTHDVRDDCEPILHAMAALTRDGVDISLFEQHFARFILDMLPAAIFTQCLPLVLALLTSTCRSVMCPAPYHGHSHNRGTAAQPRGPARDGRCGSHRVRVQRVRRRVRGAAALRWLTMQTAVARGCIDVLTAAVNGAPLPRACLAPVVATLCRTTCLGPFAPVSQDILSTILLSSVPHALLTVRLLCSSLDQKKGSPSTENIYDLPLT